MRNMSKSMEFSTKLSCNMASTRSVRGPEIEEETELSHDSPDQFQELDGVNVEEIEENETGSTKAKRQPLKRKRSKKTAEYWPDYEEFKDEEGKTRAKCKYYETSYAYDSNTIGNKNFRNHWIKCKKNPANAEKGTQTQVILNNMCKMKPWSFDANVLRRCVVEMMVTEEMPFRFVETPGLVKSFLNVVPQFKMSGRMTVQRDVYQIYIQEKEKLKLFMKRS